MRGGLSALLTLAATMAAGQPVLDLPVDCIPGKSCTIQNFVDHVPGPDAEDFRCGPLSYDGHKGTDFALPTLREMHEGVRVLAAAPGVVRGIRDGMEDRRFEPADQDAIAGRDCGNGVVIAHEDGWETQYCHMKRGSLRVKTGDTVLAGTVLGEIGLSGRTQFPHLHLSVRHQDRVVDPFATSGAATCGEAGETLWKAPPAYVPGAMLSVGFSDHVPEYEDIQAGTAARRAMPPDAAGLVLFGYAFGGQTGDILRLTIDGPDGPFLSEEFALDKAQARFFRAAGRRLAAASWPAGRYRGEVAMLRNGTEISRKTVEITIE
ncbi:MAG: M23 family metallopeptidase [Ruegeria sp.]|uniref:M23 family metallopeptidase n=1 Tax=Ruegeria sp. TaxID=1879320 RepID=UPI00349EF70C